MNKSFHIYGLLRQTMLKKSTLLMVCLLPALTMQAQEAAPDFMRSVGKIYVVAGVTIIILIALFAYLVMLDRKISRIEKRHKNE